MWWGVVVVLYIILYIYVFANSKTLEFRAEDGFLEHSHVVQTIVKSLELNHSLVALDLFAQGGGEEMYEQEEKKLLKVDRALQYAIDSFLDRNFQPMSLRLQRAIEVSVQSLLPPPAPIAAAAAAADPELFSIDPNDPQHWVHQILAFRGRWRIKMCWD